MQQYYNYNYPNPTGVLSVANPSEPERPVVVHRDGGRVPMDEDIEQPEIPPTYDSIPTDDMQ